MNTQQKSQELSALAQKLFESMQAADQNLAQRKAELAKIQAKQKLASYSVFYKQTVKGKKAEVQKLARSLKNQDFFMMEIYADEYDSNDQPTAWGITYLFVFDDEPGLLEAPKKYINEYFDGFLCNE